MTEGRQSIYGLLAEFTTAERTVAAARRAREVGYRRLDAFAPYPAEGLAEAVGMRGTSIPLFVLGGGLAGGIGGYALQVYIAMVAYPLNVGGRPLHSWPAFVVVAFELVILGAALAAVLGMLALNGLPMPYHPVFNVPSFKRASQDGFFLAIEASDPKFDRARTFEFLKSLGAKEVNEVQD